MKKRPFLFIGLASFLSALLCMLTTPLIGAATVTVAACCVYTLSKVRRGPFIPKVTALACGAAVLVACGFWVHDATVVTPQTAHSGEVVSVTVRVEQKVVTERAYVVRVEAGDLERGTRLCFWPRYREMAPENGDLITAQVELLAAFDPAYESGNAARANGVYLYAWPTEDGDCVWEDGQDSLLLPERILYTVREAVHGTFFHRMSYDTAALSEGMLLGMREHISASVGDSFRASGVYHLLAVSGVHLAIIATAVMSVLRACHCRRRTCSVITMAVIVMFMALCGFTVSINRAGVMMLIVLCGNLFRRRVDGLNSLGLAAALMLLVDPFCMYDLGWQLSFAATLGLIVFVPLWTKEVTDRLCRVYPRAARITAPVSEAIGVSLSAALTTAPLSALYFGELSTLFLPGNVVCVPLSSCLLVMTVPATLLSWCPVIGDVLFWCCEQMGWLLTAITSWLASLPFATVITHDRVIILWLSALAVAVILGYRWCRLRGMIAAVCLMAVALTAGIGLHSILYRAPMRVAAASGDQPAVAVLTDNSRGLIVAADGDALESASKLLHDEGVGRLDWVLWLAEPSVQTVDTAALTIPVEHLLIASSADGYVSLPPADVTDTLPDGVVYPFEADGTVCRKQGLVRVTVGDIVCVLVFEGEEVSAKDTEDAQILFLGEKAADACETVTAPHVTVFCGHSSLRDMKRRFPEAMFAAERHAVYIVDEDHEIHLRGR